MYDESRPAITVAKFPPVAIRITEALSQLSLSLQGSSIVLAWAWSPTPELRSINDNQSFFFYFVGSISTGRHLTVLDLTTTAKTCSLATVNLESQPANRYCIRTTNDTTKGPM